MKVLAGPDQCLTVQRVFLGWSRDLPVPFDADDREKALFDLCSVLRQVNFPSLRSFGLIGLARTRNPSVGGEIVYPKLPPDIYLKDVAADQQSGDNDPRQSVADATRSSRIAAALAGVIPELQNSPLGRDEPDDPALTVGVFDRGFQ
jgi:hypothetical protein